MENQLNEQQNENQASGQLNGDAPPALPPEFVGLPPVSEVENGTLTPDQRLVVAERYIAELLRGYQMAGNAINRLETHTFSLVKVILDSDLTTWDGFQRAQRELAGYEDLLVYWGIKEVPTPDGTETTEPAEKESSTASS